MPPRKQQASTTAKQPQPAVSAPLSFTNESTLDLQHLASNLESMAAVKVNLENKVKELFGIENDDFLNFVISGSIAENKSREASINSLKEVLGADQEEKITQLIDWFFAYLKQNYAAVENVKTTSQSMTVIDDFNINNNGVDEFALETNAPVRKVSNVGGGNGPANLLRRANEEASSFGGAAAPKKIINLGDRSNGGAGHGSAETGTNNDITSRLQKRQQHTGVDLESLIREKNQAKQQSGREQQQQQSSDIFKRVKKAHELPENQIKRPQQQQQQKQFQQRQPITFTQRQAPSEEVKLNADGSTVIDLATHKNNIRLKPQPQLQPSYSASSGGVGPSQEKKKIRCKHFPNCRESAETCVYFHPTENCKFFPNCQHGDKCLFIHPDIPCKFGVKCTRPNCAYKHDKRPSIPGVGGFSGAAGFQQALGMLMMASGLGIMPPHKVHNRKYVAGQDNQPKQGTSENAESNKPPAE